MTWADGLMDEVRRIVVQEASIPALRMGLFVSGALAAMAWGRRKPLLALCLASIGGLMGVGYWLVQMVTPLGMGNDAALTRQWAQVGVNSTAESGGLGFIVGTSPESSMLTMLASVGVPLSIVHLVPQLAVVMCLVAQIVLPWRLFRGGKTGMFAAILAVGGGLWPGVSPYGATLRDPMGLAVATLALVLSLAFLSLGILREARRRLLRSGTRVAIGLMVLASLGRALAGGTEPGLAALLLITASVLLASPVRRFLRGISSVRVPAHRLEALILFAALAGSGLLWWDPVASVPGFEATRDDLTALERPMKWIRDNVPPDRVVLAAPEYSASIAALAGRRVLFPPPAEEGAVEALSEPFRRNRLYRSTLQGLPSARLAEAFSATHLFLGPGEATPPSAEDVEGGGEPRLRLVPVYADAEDFRVFLLAKK